MRKVLGIALVMFLVAGAGAFALTIATDSVAVEYTALHGQVALLSLVGGNQVSLHITDGDYTAGSTVAGAAPSIGNTRKSDDAKDGGYLHYTLFGYGSSKITVELGESTTETYAAGSLKVKTYTPGTTTGSSDGLGSPIADYMSIPAYSHGSDLITVIPGASTYTGIGATEGARLSYKLTANPGVVSVPILYTIIGTGTPQ